TAQMDDDRAGKSGTGRFRCTTSVRPRATTCEMSRVYTASGDLTAGASVRSMACEKAFARTWAPSLNRKPLRSVNVKVFRLAEARGKPLAHSGWRRGVGPRE